MGGWGVLFDSEYNAAERLLRNELEFVVFVIVQYLSGHQPHKRYEGLNLFEDTI